MLRPSPARRLLLPAALALVAAPALAAPPRAGRLAYLGDAALPPGTTFDGVPIGGLSGLAWDERAGVFRAISDDRSEHAPARVVDLRVTLASGKLPAGGLSVAGITTLLRADGTPYPRRSIDAEGIALVPGAMFVSSEGDAAAGLPPFVGEFARDGRLQRMLPLPGKFVPRSTRWGVRNNLGFEALSASPDGKTLWVGTEGPLAQDGPAVDVGTPGLVRLRRIDLTGKGPEKEFLVPVEAVAGTPASPTAFRLRGLVDLAVLSDSRLLALEREYVAGGVNRIALYELDVTGATDVSDADVAPPGARPVEKRLVLDLGETGAPVENVEGIAFGPRLPDGRETLFLIADDNFSPLSRGTQLFAFAVSPGPTPIAAIQGAAHRSPVEGEWVLGVEGVVTAVDAGEKSRGFFLESPHPDADPRTSEGLFVSWPQGALPSPGALVAVTGRVEEAAAARGLPVTRISGRSVAAETGAASLLPPVRLFRDRTPPERNVDDDGLTVFEPETDAADFWESLEGMRASFPGGAVIGPTTSYGDVTLLPDGVEGLARTRRGGALADPRGPDQRRVTLSARLSGPPPDVSVGNRLAGPITGIVDYAFGAYRVQSVGPLQPDRPALPCTGRAAAAGKGWLTVATFNTENLSAVSPKERHAALARHLVSALGSPAILALEEIQDDSGPAKDGVVTAKGTLATFTAAIRDAGGPAYEPVWIDPVDGKEGGQPGGNIRVALLLDPSRVRFVRRGDAGPLDEVQVTGTGASTRLSLNPGRVAPRSAAFTIETGEGVRRSLAVELEASGRTLFVVVNHLSSKSSDDRLFGSSQPPKRPTDARRLAQAVEVRAFLGKLLEADPDALVVALGDLNDGETSEPVRTLAAPPFENLVLRVPAEERYSFNFEGLCQQLDHVVASPAAAKGAEVEVVHVNADCPDSLRSSDHDPVVVRLPLAARE